MPTSISNHKVRGEVGQGKGGLLLRPVEGEAGNEPPFSIRFLPCSPISSKLGELSLPWECNTLPPSTLNILFVHRFLLGTVFSLYKYLRLTNALD